MKTITFVLGLLGLIISSNVSAFQYAPRASAVMYGVQVAQHVQVNGLQQPARTVKTVHVDERRNYQAVVDEYSNLKVSDEYRR